MWGQYLTYPRIVICTTCLKEPVNALFTEAITEFFQNGVNPDRAKLISTKFTTGTPPSFSKK